MQTKKEEYYSLGDVTVAVKSFFLYLTRKWWILLLAAGIGIVLGLGYFATQKPKYQATSTFILEESQGGGGGGLSSLASQFGFDIGGLGGGNIFAGDNILDILKSKKVVQEVLLSRVSSGEKTLADLYIDFTNIRERWKKSPELAAVNFSQRTTSQLTRIQDSAMTIIYENILKKHLAADRANKKGTIIKVQVTATSQEFARQMTQRLVDAASKLYLSIKTGTAQGNIDLLQRRADSLLALLNNKSFAAASMQPLDINPGLRSAAVPTEIVTRDKTVIATIYTEVTKNLEASKMLLSQQTPVIQLLDTPGNSLFDNKKTLFFCIASGAVALFVLAAGFFAIKFFLKNMAAKKA